MKIAIIGSGFAGLATCFYLLQSKKVDHVHLFDKRGLACGASGVAAGLLHPFSGPKTKKSLFADEAFPCALSLLQLASRRTPIALFSGILRPCTTEEHHIAYNQISEPDIECWPKEKTHEENPALLSLPSLFIRSGVAVHTKEYLKELWLLCESMGAQFEAREIATLQELSGYDHIVIACGYESSLFEESKKIGLSQLKGQLLELSWKEGLPPVRYPLNSEGYLVMHPATQRVFAGATFERNFTTPLAVRERAEPEIRRKIAAFSPTYSELPLISCQAGVRAYAKNRLPLVGRLEKNYWLITGLGSKGLLYHSWLGKLLAQSIIDNDESCLPKAFSLT